MRTRKEAGLEKVWNGIGEIFQRIAVNYTVHELGDERRRVSTWRAKWDQE